MATSGTVGQTVFSSQMLIDHVCRRCSIVPQQITAETIQTILDLLHLQLSALSSASNPLWTIDEVILPVYENQRSVLLPVGSVDVMSLNLRQVTRLSGTYTSSEGTAANAFDADTTTACTQTTQAGNIAMQLTSAALVDTLGIRANATGTWSVSLQGSEDGITYTTLFTNAALSAVSGEWYWVDVEEMTTHTYFRLLANGTTVLDVAELVFANSPQDIPMYKMNMDDYSNLPNKNSSGRPTQFWYDKQAAGQGVQNVVTVWPLPSSSYITYQYSGYVKKLIQDVGTMAQEIEVPQQWLEAIICGVARKASPPTDRYPAR